MHVIEGVVKPGDQRGRTVGFPTANIPLLSHEAQEAHDGVGLA
ncbi:riboflavin kinase [Sinomonas mesophila]|nr:riboflavin kinase [Sinomonas mesophila]